MERKIGEVFEYNGDKLVVVADAGCSTCYFGRDCYKKQDDPVAGYCSKNNRNDGRDIAFHYCGKAHPENEPQNREENRNSEKSTVESPVESPEKPTEKPTEGKTAGKTEPKKNDRLDGKPRWELLPLPDLEDIVEVYTFGAEKYGPHTWRDLEDGFDRYKAALLRHLVSFDRGEEFDKESGLPALAHMAWNAIAMLAIWNDARHRRPAQHPEVQQPQQPSADVQGQEASQP